MTHFPPYIATMGNWSSGQLWAVMGSNRQQFPDKNLCVHNRIIKDINLPWREAKFTICFVV